MNEYMTEVNQVAQQADQRASFRQLRTDMRYLARAMRRMNEAKVQEPQWGIAYSYLWDANRRLGLRYDKETLIRMKQVVIRTHGLKWSVGL